MLGIQWEGHMMEVSTLCKSITTIPPTEQVRHIQHPMVVDEYKKVFHYSLEHDVLNHLFFRYQNIRCGTQ